MSDRREGETPAEYALRLMLEDSALLERCAETMRDNRDFYAPGRPRWAELAEAERQKWRDEAIAAQRTLAGLDPALADVANQVMQREWIEERTRRLDAET